MTKLLDGRWEEFDNYMPTHTLKEGAWHFNMSYYSVIYWIKKRCLTYKGLRRRKIINIDTGEIYSCTKDLANMLGCPHQQITAAINRGYRCRGLKLAYYWGTNELGKSGNI